MRGKVSFSSSDSMAKEIINVARHVSAMPPPRASVGGVTNKSAAKMRPSQRLEEDAQAMEERLAQLRIKMLEDKQKLEKELPAKFGGARWRSAQETIGSVSRYAKDVEDRMSKTSSVKATSKKKTNNVDTTSNGAPKRKTKSDNGSAMLVPSIATVKKWTTGHVLEWLTSLGLDEFHSTFEFHQVTGRELLEMQPEEFINIGVTRLSARNQLWKELDRMKEAAATGVDRGSMEASEIIDPKIKDVAPVPEASLPGEEGRVGVHWSHIKPLRDPNSPSHQAEIPVNLADGEFDEDAGHASFMKALLDWRAGDDDTKGTSNDQDDEMWFNPLVSTNISENSPSGRGGALLEGDYDEAKEQEAFRRAVMAWRRAGTPSGETDSRPSTAEVDRIEQGCSTDLRKSCWHCYRVVQADSLVRDARTNHDFCGRGCLASFQKEHARLYAKIREEET